MTETIEEQCLIKGVKLTEQRKIIARVIQIQKKNMANQIILTLMNFTIVFQKLIQK